MDQIPSPPFGIPSLNFGLTRYSAVGSSFEKIAMPDLILLSSKRVASVTSFLARGCGTCKAYSQADLTQVLDKKHTLSKRSARVSRPSLFAGEAEA